MKSEPMHALSFEGATDLPIAGALEVHPSTFTVVLDSNRGNQTLPSGESGPRSPARPAELIPSQEAGRCRTGLPIRWSRLISYLVLSLGAACMVLPFVWMGLSVVKQPDEMIAYPPVWISANPSLDLLKRMWTQINFGRLFANSVFVTTIATLGVSFTCVFVSYVLAKYQFPGRDALFFAILATMMIPWPVLLIPQYLVAVKLDLTDTYAGLIVPALFSSFGIFLMRQHMHSIPDELIEAARIDGAAEPIIFARIVLPLTTSTLSALVIFHFLWNWDSFIWPLVVISGQDMYTLPLGLALFTTRHYTDLAAANAGAFLAVLPVIAVFLILQRNIIEGVAMTGIR